MFSSLPNSHPESGIFMTRILVADDHQIVRAGLKNLLADYKEFTVAGEAGSGTEALKMVREADWDVVLLDISMPDMNGIDTLKQIKRSKPALPVLILTIITRLIYCVRAPTAMCARSARPSSSSVQFARSPRGADT